MKISWAADKCWMGDVIFYILCTILPALYNCFVYSDEQVACDRKVDEVPIALYSHSYCKRSRSFGAYSLALMKHAQKPSIYIAEFLLNSE